MKTVSGVRCSIISCLSLALYEHEHFDPLVNFVKGVPVGVGLGAVCWILEIPRDEFSGSWKSVALKCRFITKRDDEIESLPCKLID